MIYKVDPTVGDFAFGEQEQYSTLVAAALDVLGPASKEKLAKYLKKMYGISIWSVNPSRLDELKDALQDLFGETSAALLMRHIYLQISKMEH